MEKSLHYVAIDGANFVNRLIDWGHDAETISKSISIASLAGMIQHQVRSIIGTTRSIGVDFFHSPRRMGPQNKKLSKEQQDYLLIRIGTENGVTTREISLMGRKEKGVDIAIASSLFEMSSHCETLVLVSADRDFIPVLRSLKRMGRFVCTVGFYDGYPLDLMNESQYFFDISNWDLSTN